MTPELESTVKAIKKSGFGYLKVELEATLNRPDDYDERVECTDCYGDGREDCEDCSGEGTVEVNAYSESGRDLGTTVDVECESCDGEGRQECGNCYGYGDVENENANNFGSEDSCGQYILDYVSAEARNALNYSEFYNDGSVDSEFTFTIPVEKAHLLPEFIEAFKALSNEIGEGLEVDGAGMHVAVLPHESNGRYPVRGFQLDMAGITNFQNEVTKLLPALFIAACSGNFTRGLEYRRPQITNDKYSAIHIVDGSCLEFRLFETCYQRPEAIFEYLGTIARTLEYYKDPSKKVASMGKEFTFFDTRGVQSLMSTPDQVRIIKKQLKLVAPKHMKLSELQTKRDIVLSVATANKDYNKKVTRAKALYKEHIKAYKTALARPLTHREQLQYQEYERYDYFQHDWDDERKKAYTLGIRVPELNEKKFIDNNITGHRVSTLLAV